MVAVDGVLDGHTGNPVLYRLLRDIVPNAVLVVDLSGLTVVDAAGVGALLAARARARRLGGELCLSGVPGTAQTVLVEAAPAGDRLDVLPGQDPPAMTHVPARLPSRPQTRPGTETVIGPAEGVPRVS
ncbi:MAG TPA: STAS domain-containing protein [Mycobacteriales bacterium]|nr:STAS domain-containing protein [Mycobacteriales bacterium]